MDIKLKDFIYEFALEQEKPKVNKYEVTEAIKIMLGLVNNFVLITTSWRLLNN